MVKLYVGKKMQEAKTLGKKETNRTKFIEENITENSRDASYEFFSLYDDSSLSTVRSNIYKLIYDELQKIEIAHITYDDFLKVKSTNKLTSLRQQFFKFLYAFDYLDSKSGFDSEWIQEKLVEDFLKEKEESTVSVSNDEKTDKNTLTITELIQVQRIIELETSKLDTLRMQFCWYALFDLGLDVEELRRNITSDSYLSGKIQTSLGEITIPGKYHQMFIELSKRESNNGFYSLKKYLGDLGKDAGLQRTLMPKMIKHARKKHLFKCGDCFNTFSNLSYNWASVNNLIVCVSCAEKLKKKLNYQVKVKSVDNTNVDTTFNQDTSKLFTYDELKSKLKNKTVDYLKLHEFQMEIGKLGEAYVYKLECEKLKDTKYLYMIDERKAQNPANGYDILSFTTKGEPLHIEVKATIGKENVFHLSEHERKTAEHMAKKGLTYVVYFIEEVMSDNPKLEIIKNVTTNENYNFETKNWVVSKKQVSPV